MKSRCRFSRQGNPFIERAKLARRKPNEQNAPSVLKAHGSTFNVLVSPRLFE